MKNGQTLVEMIVVVGVVVLMVTGIVAGTITSLHRSEAIRLRATAIGYAQQGLELSREKRDLGWRFFQSMGTPESLYCVGSDLQFVPSAVGCNNVIIEPQFIRTVTLTYQGAALPPQMNVTSNVVWGDVTNPNNSLTLTTVLTDWR